MRLQVQSIFSETMKRSAALIFLISLGVANLHADEQVRVAQEQLKNQGFYYGQADGEPGAETSAAIRRYQIRNGLQVTGTLTQETLDALKTGNARAADSTAPAQQPSPAGKPSPDAGENDRDFLRKRSEPASPPAPPAPPRDPSIVSPPVEFPAHPTTISAQYAALFARTPYENAPIEVQRKILKSAQLCLLRERFYEGSADGIPGPATARAISLFQDDANLRRTARLDFETLRELRLLPVSGRPIITEPFYPPPARPGVYRGIWVR